MIDELEIRRKSPPLAPPLSERELRKNNPSALRGGGQKEVPLARREGGNIMILSRKNYAFFLRLRRARTPAPRAIMVPGSGAMTIAIPLIFAADAKPRVWVPAMTLYPVW